VMLESQADVAKRGEIPTLEASVQVGLLAQGHDLLEVDVVDVGVNTEEALEDVLHHTHEVLREGDVWLFYRFCQ
jgi:hypothetical protein